MCTPLNEHGVQTLLDGVLEWVREQDDVLEQQFAEQFLSMEGLAAWISQQSVRADNERRRQQDIDAIIEEDER